LWLIAILVLLQAPAIARDRPGTPNQPFAWTCTPQSSMAKPHLCFTFVNTAGHDKVHFEIEMNAMPLAPQRQQCVRSDDSDPTGCIVGDGGNGSGLEGNIKYGIDVPDLEFDGRYCFKVRTRRADDQVVSELWSAAACAQTRSKPVAPGKPNVGVQFFVSEIRVPLPTDTSGNSPNLRLKIANRDSSEANFPAKSGGSGSSRYYSYELHQNEDQIPIEVCAENISGRQCAEIVVSAKQGKVLSDVSNLAPPPPTGVLHVTGKAVGDPLPPPGPSGPSAFVGVWDTHTGQNGHFRVTFSESNGVLVGKFEDLNGNAQYNGTLTQKPGTQVSSQFFYTYEQPTTKGSGSGEFMVETNGKLIGKIVTNDNPPVKTGWFGNRVGAPPGPDVK
jgi:hypothetical protein